MTTSVTERLDALRGDAPAKHHNARTIAALAGNPRCALRAVMDAAGIDKGAIAARVGFPAPFGQSQFAITRGNAFEAKVKALGCAELLRLLREVLGLPESEVAYDDLEQVGYSSSPQVRFERTRELLAKAAVGGGGTLFDHPMLRLWVGGNPVYLEPDLVAFQIAGRFHVVEIKSFPIIDGQGDPVQVKAATTQAAAYVIALRAMLEEMGVDPAVVSDRVVLVAPKDFSFAPTAAFVDARKQVSTLTRQLARLERIGGILDQVPDGVTFDLKADEDGAPMRPAGELAGALEAVEANYRPDCLAHCELAFFCRDRARTACSVDVLGTSVRERLGGIDTVTMALGLAGGGVEPEPEQAEAAAALRHAAGLRAALMGRVA
jgi:hypothetical protein